MNESGEKGGCVLALMLPVPVPLWRLPGHLKHKTAFLSPKHDLSNSWNLPSATALCKWKLAVSWHRWREKKEENLKKLCLTVENFMLAVHSQINVHFSKTDHALSFFFFLVISFLNSLKVKVFLTKTGPG